MGKLDVSVNFGIKPSEAIEEKADEPIDSVLGVGELFNSVFLYFFVAAGFTLIILAVLFCIGRRRKLRGEVLAVGVRAFIGVGLVLVALLALPSLKKPENSHDQSLLDNFIFSPWMLPTVLMAYSIGKQVQLH